VVGYKRVASTEEALQEAVANIGPISASVDVGSTKEGLQKWRSYKSGEFSIIWSYFNKLLNFPCDSKCIITILTAQVCTTVRAAMIVIRSITPFWLLAMALIRLVSEKRLNSKIGIIPVICKLPTQVFLQTARIGLSKINGEKTGASRVICVWRVTQTTSAQLPASRRIR
jgi:hypothetical protein